MKKYLLTGLLLSIAAIPALSEYNYITIIRGSERVSYPIEGTDRVIFTEEDETTPGEGYELRVLTFEDADYRAGANMVGAYSWTSLIDSPQYGGPLLYPASADDLYHWYDENNTFLAHDFPNSYGDGKYWGGGHAISNYVDTDLLNGDFMHQLAVYECDAEGHGGHNGSANFAVHNGYKDDVMGAYNVLPALYFGDGQARVIDHMYVCATTYLAYCVANDNGLTSPVGEDGYVKLVAIGYDAEGNESGRVEFEIANGQGVHTSWEKWDLSPLGEVLMVEFNMEGNSDNGFGFSQPAYFAYDDVAVRFPL